MTETLLRVLALVLIVEGVMPFLSPTRFRANLLRLASLEDRHLRLFGFIALIIATLLLQLS